MILLKLILSFIITTILFISIPEIGISFWEVFKNFISLWLDEWHFLTDEQNNSSLVVWWWIIKLVVLIFTYFLLGIFIKKILIIIKWK
jgi:hypothetical protein